MLAQAPPPPSAGASAEAVSYTAGDELENFTLDEGAA